MQCNHVTILIKQKRCVYQGSKSCSTSISLTIFRQKLLLWCKLVSNYTACSHFNLISDIVTITYHDNSSSCQTGSTNKGKTELKEEIKNK